MKVWNLTAPKHLEMSESPIEPEEEKIRVRVTKVLVYNMDGDFYSGAIKIPASCIPGRFAVGMVAEETSHPLFPKDRRVLLHTFRPAERGGTDKYDFSESDFQICGQTVDGFLRDIVYLGPDEMTPLPDSVADDQAILLHHVALAKAAVDRLDPQKGRHIAVIGANLVGILVCQLLIYQQAAPILIDADPERLDFAHRNGVYYTALADETLIDNIGATTGGRMTSGAIFCLSSKNDVDLPFRVCANGTPVILCGLAPTNLKADIDFILRKQNVLHVVSDPTDYIETAINLVAQKAVAPACFKPTVYRANDAEEAFKCDLHEIGKIVYINLV